ncbi:MAG: NAD(P)-binding domain-containing protein, partial [Altererythrobacter sp.]|nr:NAD(P)-binding domain-containing protein [Altererythrobacter sp.]
MTSHRPVGVLGAGAWGTALAQMLASDGRDVVLWALESDVVEEVNRAHRNTTYLPSAKLAETIRATSDLGEFAELEIVLAVTPAQHLGSVLRQMPKAPRDLVLCSKGIEAGTGRLMND